MNRKKSAQKEKGFSIIVDGISLSLLIYLRDSLSLETGGNVLKNECTYSIPITIVNTESKNLSLLKPSK